jgi:hypothetical protein
VRYNGLDRSDPSAGLDVPGHSGEDPWEALEEKLRKTKLKYSPNVPEEERQFLGWPE